MVSFVPKTATLLLLLAMTWTSIVESFVLPLPFTSSSTLLSMPLHLHPDQAADLEAVANDLFKAQQLERQKKQSSETVTVIENEEAAATSQTSTDNVPRSAKASPPLVGWCRRLLHHKAL